MSIAFGTDGWRAVIADTFTFGNLRRVAQAVADYVIQEMAANDDQKLDRLIDQLVANQRARWDRELTRVAELRKLLAPRQAARLLDILPKIDRRILQGLRRAVAGPGADDGEEDDGPDVAPPRVPRRARRSVRRSHERCGA